MKRIAVYSCCMLLILAGCTQSGRDYSHNFNQIELLRRDVNVRFNKNAAKPDKQDLDRLKSAVLGTEKLSGVMIYYNPSRLSKTRMQHLKRFLLGLDVSAEIVDYEVRESLKANMFNVSIITAKITLPDCESQRTERRYYYMNTANSEFGCVNNRNIGLMVNDPLDTVRGRGNANVDTEQAIRAVEKLKGSAPAGGAAGGADASASAAESAPAAPGQ